MSSKIVWNALIAVSTLLSGTGIASSSVLAADAHSTAGTPSTETSNSDSGVSTSSTTTHLTSVQIAPSSENRASAQNAADITDITVQNQIMQYSHAAPRPASVPVSQAAVTEASTQPLTSANTLDEIMQYSNEGPHEDQAQVTSITQLSDVQPTDWAFQALQSLVERYGCIAGYPDGTYKGQRALTRFEFAAGLNACLDRISELIASSTADLATKEDLATLQRLQEEFAAELATLRGRVDSLEARVGELEANQFSTTTKLKGEIIFAAAANFSSDEDFVSDQPIAGYRVRLNFDTSFTGNDLLRARLQARDFNNFYSFGGSVGATEWTFSNEAPGSGADGNVTLDRVYYTFPLSVLSNDVRFTISARGLPAKDAVVSTINPFESDAQGTLTNFSQPPMYYFLATGAGASARFSLGGLVLDAGYLADSADAPDSTPGSGLFNGNYGAFVQLSYLSKFVDAALLYGNGYNTNGFFSSLGVASGPQVANTYGGQVNFKFGQFEVGGGLAYVPIRAIGQGDYNVWSYQATIGLRDFGTEGSLLGVQAGVTPYAAGIPGQLVTSNAGTNQGNNVLVEGFYRFRLNDNISITPALIWMSAPDNNNDNSDTFVGALRTSFTF